MLKGLIFLHQDFCVWGPEIGLRTLTPVGDTLQYNYFPVFVLPTWGYGIFIWLVYPFYPSYCGSLFISLFVEELFGYVSVFFMDFLLQIVVILGSL